MKINTIKNYIVIMDEMLTSDCTSIHEYCDKLGVNYNTFMIQISKLKKLANKYDKACSIALQKYELVKQKFNLNKEEKKLNNEVDKYFNITKEENSTSNSISKEIDENQLDNYFNSIKTLN